MTLLLRVLWTLLLAGFAPLAAGDESPSGLSRMLHSIDSTTPFPIASHAQQEEGWFSGAWDGTKRIWNEGKQDLYLSGYVWHVPYGWSAEKRERFNDDAWGLGYGRTLTDERDNQRMLYAIIASDSYRKPMVMSGYAWIARWPLAGEVRIGAGYSALMVWHESTAHFPVPVAAPVATIGNDSAGLYVTYINKMMYFFGKVTFK